MWHVLLLLLLLLLLSQGLRTKSLRSTAIYVYAPTHFFKGKHYFKKKKFLLIFFLFYYTI